MRNKQNQRAHHNKKGPGRPTVHSKQKVFNLPSRWVTTDDFNDYFQKPLPVAQRREFKEEARRARRAEARLLARA